MTTATATAAPAAPKAERILLAVNNQPAVFESLLFITAEQTLAEFGQQFDSLRQQLARLQGIAQRRDQALTTGEKDALGKVLEQEANDLNAKDSLFQKVYGFRVVGLGNRPVKMLQTRRLLLEVTDEELAKAKQEKDFKPENVVVANGKNHLLASTMSGLALEEFLRNYQVITNKRTNLINAKAAAEKATGEDKTRLDNFVKETEAEIIKDNELMAKTYGFSLARNFTMDFVEAKLFVMLTEEEVQKVQGAQAAEATAKKPTAEKSKN